MTETSGTDTITKTAFDYSTLDADTAAAAQAAASRIKERTRAAVVDTGRDLLAMKDALGYGPFGAWVRAEFTMTARSAERYMAAAKFLDGKSDTVSYLPTTTLYKLSAASAPADVVQEVVAAAEAGAPLPVKEIETKLARAREDERRIKRVMDGSSGPAAREAAEKTVAEARAEEARELAELEQQETARMERLAPLAIWIAKGIGPNFTALRAALASHSDRGALPELIAAAQDELAEVGLLPKAGSAPAERKKPAPRPEPAKAPVDPTRWQNTRDQCVRSSKVTKKQFVFLASLGERGAPTPAQISKLEHIAAQVGAAT